MIVKASNRFSTLLGERKLKISKVAKDTGISRTTLTNLYYGKTKGVTFAVLEKLCTYFGCSPGDLL